MNEEVNKNFIKNIINKNNNKSLKRKNFEKFKFLNLIFLYLIINPIKRNNSTDENP